MHVNGVTFRTSAKVTISDQSKHINPPEQAWVEVNLYAGHGDTLDNVGPTGHVYIRYIVNGMDLVRAVPPKRSAQFNYATLMWTLIDDTQATVNPVRPVDRKCTCGVKFTGGTCSDWCDTVRTDE